MESPSPDDGRAEALLSLVTEVARELHPRRAAPALGLDSALERDAGIDSLGRVELLLRIERRFGVALPESAAASAETPRDLLRALADASATGRRSVGASERRSDPVTLRPSDAPTLRPDMAASLVDVLEWQAAHGPDRPHLRFYAEGAEGTVLTPRGLLDGAEAVAAGLRSLDLAPGQAVGLMLPSGPDYFLSFFGILLAGGVPTPIYPPARLSQLEDHLRRQVGILGNALAGALITVPEAHAVSGILKAHLPELRSVTTAPELAAHGGPKIRAKTRPEDIALLQYTSGSTGDPKGNILSHANLLANIRAMGQVTGVGAGDVFVSWLPLYHDMGLIGAWLGSLYHGLPLVLMSPLDFIVRPSRWLRALHERRGTISAAPNFAYELCASRVDEADLAGLDLSSWRLALNGAEPVSPDTMRRFSERFARYGFRPEAMTPVYGLAENSLGLAFPPPGRGPRIDRVNRDVFVRTGRVEDASPEDPHPLRFVSCGPPIPGHEVRIVDPSGRELGDREEGRLEFRGPSATAGYFRNPDATRALLRGEWRDSGDYAYIAEGEIHITGRAKDVIFRAGRNIYPYEVEEAVGEIPGVRKGCVAVFAVRAPDEESDRLVVLAETREEDPAAREALKNRIGEITTEVVHTPPDDIVLALPGTVLKTSSGKVRRSACRELYESGALGRARRGVALQFLRLYAAGFRPALRRLRRSLGATAYAVYAALLLAAIAPGVWTIVLLLPDETRRRRFVRAAGRAFFALLRIPVRVEGLDRIPADRPCVIASNHASYLDSFLLTAVLPPAFAFVAKKELTGSFIARSFLERLGTEFVERHDLEQRSQDARRLMDRTRAGRSLVIFPEGTLFRAPGLRPFHLGGFAAAGGAGLPVVPVALRGTRSVLRDGTWFVRHGTVTVAVLPPIAPDGEDWAAAVRLRDRVREEILRHCGEPDLAG